MILRQRAVEFVCRTEADVQELANALEGLFGRYPLRVSKPPNDIARINAAGEELASLYKQLADLPVETNPQILLHAAIQFGMDSCGLAVAALEHQAWMHPFVIARPLVDLVLRLYWAAIMPDGWDRYFAYWAASDRKFAEDGERLLSAHFQGPSPFADFLTDKRKTDLYNRYKGKSVTTTVNGKPKTKTDPATWMPNELLKLFSDLKAQHHAVGTDELRNFIQFKSLHRTTHGHPETLTQLNERETTMLGYHCHVHYLWATAFLFLIAAAIYDLPALAAQAERFTRRVLTIE